MIHQPTMCERGWSVDPSYPTFRSKNVDPVCPHREDILDWRILLGDLTRIWYDPWSRRVMDNWPTQPLKLEHYYWFIMSWCWIPHLVWSPLHFLPFLIHVIRQGGLPGSRPGSKATRRVGSTRGIVRTRGRTGRRTRRDRSSIEIQPVGKSRTKIY